MNQGDAQLGTAAFNHLSRARKVAKLTTEQLDRRLKNGEVQRRYKVYRDKGLSIGDGKRATCSKGEALEAAISDVFIADQRLRDKRPYAQYTQEAHVNRIEQFISGATSDLKIDTFVPDMLVLAKTLRQTHAEADLVRLMAAEQAGRNATGSMRPTVMDAIFKRLASLREVKVAPEISAEAKAALIADDE